MSETISFLTKNICSGATHLGIGAHKSQVDYYKKQANLLDYNSTVCEVGFNCGHSASVFLDSNNSLNVVSFDLPNYKWTSNATKYMKNKYGKRLYIINGNSLVTIPKQVSSKTIMCDLFIVDGAHNFINPFFDILNLLKLSSCNTRIIMDDVCDYKKCHAHFSNGNNNHVVIGPTQAWEEAKRSGYIYQEELITSAFDRGWALGKPVCYKNNYDKNITIKNLNPVFVSYHPNKPTNAQYSRDKRQREEIKKYLK